MKTLVKSLIAILFLASCSESDETGNTPPPIFPSPTIIALNTEEGYAINPVTGDSIEPIINSLGDTVKTGVPIPSKGNRILVDNVAQPQTYIVPPIEQLTKKDAQPNVHFVPDELMVVPINRDSLTIILLEEISPNDTGHYIVNGTGDKVPTGVPITVQGKTVSTYQPQPIQALPPMFKDAAKSNLQYLDLDQGMNSSNVESILEDKNGNLWFGTDGGVSKYDGELFTHFTVKEGLSNNRVKSILEDKDGNIWFGTNGGGVSRYNGESFTHLTEKEGLSNNIVRSIIEDRIGNLWFGTDGGGVSRYNGESFTHLTEKEGLSNNSVYSIKEDKIGNLWFGTNAGVCKYDGESFTHFTEKEGLSSNRVLSILEDKAGNLWFGTDGGGVSRYNGESFTHFTVREGLSNNSVFSIIEDKIGNLWFSTWGGGVSKYNGKFFTHFTEKEGLSNNHVTSILKDIAGNLWFGTHGGGVCKYNGNSFTHYTEKEGLGSNWVLCILEDKAGNLWFSNGGEGVSRYDGQSFTHFTEKEGLSSNWVFSSIEDKSGNLWFGTYGGGVSRYNGESFTHFTVKEGLSSNWVLSILEDKAGNLWFGTDGGGVSRYNGESFTHFTEKEGLSNNRVRSILEDKNGNLWFGTNGGGVSCYNGESFIHFTEKEGLSRNRVLSILEDENGNLWFGTDGGGVCLYNGDSFTHFTEKEGLSNNIVYSITEDKNRNLWLSTHNGLNQFVRLEPVLRASKERVALQTLSLTEQEAGKINKSEFSGQIIRFEKNDGLKARDFFVNSVCLDSKNRIYWGSGKSLTMLDLNQHFINQHSPVIFLKQLLINEAFIDYRNISDNLGKEIEFSGVQRFENYPLNLELSSRQNSLTFHYAAIDWSAPHKIQYSYLIERIDKAWSEPTKETKADYRNLPYGEHTFKVCAIGESGEWSEPFEYSFTILPPWYHTWWARGGYACAGIFLLIGTVRLRTATLKKRQKELEEEVDNATTVIKEQKEEVEKSLKETQRQKEVIEVAHKEIKDSIEYAKRIQTAILPPPKIVKEYLSDSFILYLPKDVVAGDFYWMEQKDGKTLFAAADCTGHGVPGAMVSVICNNGLNRSVREYGITEPGKILDKTREIVIREFEKSEEEVKDGMDIALCSVEDNILEFAGANNPLWLIRNNELIEIKADKQPIGVFDEPKPYTTHRIELQKGDVFYVFSDGFADQFGGPQDKKFMKGNMKKLFLSVQNETMEKQKELIEEAFMNWKGKLEQIDDVCVIGVRV